MMERISNKQILEHLLDLFKREVRVDPSEINEQDLIALAIEDPIASRDVYGSRNPELCILRNPKLHNQNRMPEVVRGLYIGRLKRRGDVRWKYSSRLAESEEVREIGKSLYPVSFGYYTIPLYEKFRVTVVKERAPLL